MALHTAGRLYETSGVELSNHFAPSCCKHHPAQVPSSTEQRSKGLGLILNIFCCSQVISCGHSPNARFEIGGCSSLGNTQPEATEVRSLFSGAELPRGQEHGLRTRCLG